jgi:hypothetical protein
MMERRAPIAGLPRKPIAALLDKTNPRQTLRMLLYIVARVRTQTSERLNNKMAQINCLQQLSKRYAQVWRSCD